MSQGATEAGDLDTPIADEAHIVGAKPGSARFRTLSDLERDGYENRILLCPSDHRLIDRQPEAWPEERLRQVKGEHEAKMRRRTDDADATEPFPVFRPEPFEMPPLYSGKAIADVIGGAGLHQFEYDDPKNADQRDATRAFITAASDWMDVWDVIGTDGRFDVDENMNDLNTDLHAVGLVAFGAQTSVKVDFWGSESRMQLAAIWIRRIDLIAEEERSGAEPPPPSGDGVAE
ncbi:MAG: hypothetical protein BGO23_11855 [Solirubrobacterales bacterium 67-14]|nr:MAG: hypothetical protein BGO23_11855 [Solirubrobacterales bacterium 67-14]